MKGQTPVFNNHHPCGSHHPKHMLMPGVNRALFTLLSDVAEALLLNGLVIHEALDFRGGAVYIRVLEGGKKA